MVLYLSNGAQIDCQICFTRCNEQIAELESVHEEKVAIIRRSFKQQLSDALMSLSSQNAADMLNRNKKPKEEKKKPGKDKALELKLQNEQLQKEIEELKSDLELLQQVQVDASQRFPN